ncbi:hypothetical protein EDB89DRAFT_1911650 [Lactarius sanguifluus]|nr:hypothetical protein EDB89DRAFT_1911650 [Lactarius sanguifluus]
MQSTSTVRPNGDAVSEESAASGHRRLLPRIGAGVTNDKSSAPPNETNLAVEAASELTLGLSTHQVWQRRWNASLNGARRPALHVLCMNEKADDEALVTTILLEATQVACTQQEPAQAKGIETLELEHWNRDMTHWSYLTWLRPAATLKLRVKRAEPDINYVSGVIWV